MAATEALVRWVWWKWRDTEAINQPEAYQLRVVTGSDLVPRKVRSSITKKLSIVGDCNKLFSPHPPTFPPRLFMVTFPGDVAGGLSSIIRSTNT